VIIFEKAVQLLAPIEPGWCEFLLQGQTRWLVLFALIEVQDVGHFLIVELMTRFELVEEGLILLRENGLAVVGHLLVQALFEALVHGLIGGGHFATSGKADKLLGQVVAVDPGTADHRTEIHPGNRIGPDSVRAIVDLHQPGKRHHDHQQHDRDNHRKARQNALA